MYSYIFEVLSHVVGPQSYTGSSSPCSAACSCLWRIRCWGSEAPEEEEEEEILYQDICILFSPSFWYPLTPAQEPNDEEEAQLEKITMLKERWRCGDKKCQDDLCFVAPSGDHICLTPLHLRIWSAVIVSPLFLYFVLIIMCSKSGCWTGRSQQWSSSKH